MDENKRKEIETLMAEARSAAIRGIKENKSFVFLNNQGGHNGGIEIPNAKFIVADERGGYSAHEYAYELNVGDHVWLTNSCYNYSEGQTIERTTLNNMAFASDFGILTSPVWTDKGDVVMLETDKFIVFGWEADNIIERAKKEFEYIKTNLASHALEHRSLISVVSEDEIDMLYGKESNLHLLSSAELKSFGLSKGVDYAVYQSDRNEFGTTIIMEGPASHLITTIDFRKQFVQMRNDLAFANEMIEQINEYDIGPTL